MRISELLLERNLGYDADRKIPTGSAKDWMSAIGATPEDVEKARAEVLKSPEYLTLVNDRGMRDASTDRAKSNGTIILKMEYLEPAMKAGWVDRKTGKKASEEELKSISYFDKWEKYKLSDLGRAPGNKLHKVYLHYNVQPHGKIDFTAPNGYHRWPAPSGKPALIHGKPVESIVKTMKSALRDLDRLIGKRMAKLKKQFDMPLAESSDDKKLSFAEFQKSAKHGKAEKFPELMHGNDLQPDQEIIVYDDGSFIEKGENGIYALIIGNQEWAGKDLAKIEKTLYTEWYGGKLDEEVSGTKYVMTVSRRDHASNTRDMSDESIDRLKSTFMSNTEKAAVKRLEVGDDVDFTHMDGETRVKVNVKRVK